MKGAIAKADELAATIPNAIIPQQFENPANPEIHRTTTAEEIWNDTHGEVDIFVAGIGTGGTITGVGQVLKERKPSVHVVPSSRKPRRAVGRPARPAQDPGHRRRLLPEILDTTIYDEIVKVSNERSVANARLVARLEGVPVGISSGAALRRQSWSARGRRTRARTSSWSSRPSPSAIYRRSCSRGWGLRVSTRRLTAALLPSSS